MTLKPLYEMLSSIAVIVMLWLMYKAFVWVRKLFIEAHVCKHGIAANADIVAFHRTNRMDRTSVWCEIGVRFTTREGHVEQASITVPLAYKDANRLAAGDGTTIKYDPHKPEHVVLYDRPLILGD
ncbi:hypothetical protein PU683_08520 [Kosakonia cowanii]|uniref:DUF3592 domain-containing protein n=1 Tax=Kosakonia cowanii TaxID=208223 RepID=UPI0023F83C12|nr:DUF3592 domain-containing protein [Kosakonia cowanii]MDF7759570.1 hypothetical protein [Kosakonia cowanii]